MNRLDLRFPGRRERTRCRGSVALIMILVLVLLVGTYAAAVGRRAASEQRGDYERQSRMIIQSAIDTVAERKTEEGESSVRLPLDSENNRWIIVERVVSPGGQDQHRAAIYHRGKALHSLVRPLRDGQ